MPILHLMSFRQRAQPNTNLKGKIQMPEVQQVHIDAALTNLSVAYRNNDYIAELIAPRVAVRKQSDRYYIYDAERESIRATEDMRAPGSLASEVDYTLRTDSYYCNDHALASAVADEEAGER